MELSYTPLQGSCSSCRKELGHDVVEAVLFRQLSGCVTSRQMIKSINWPSTIFTSSTVFPAFWYHQHRWKLIPWRNIGTSPLTRLPPLRTETFAPQIHQTTLPFPASNDTTMNGAPRQQTPRCVYVGLVLICGHTHYKLLHDCTSCLQQLQQIQHSPNAEYSFNWPALCRPTPGVNVYFVHVPAPQVCPSCQQQGLRWRGSTGLYS